MELNGYKGFNSNKTNRYGTSFEEGKIYHADGIIKCGLKSQNGNGFHFCLRLGNIFRYYDDSNLLIARVTGYGVIDEVEATPYEDLDYDIYASEYLRVDKFMSREEVIDTLLNSPETEIRKFLISGKPSVKELERIYDRYVGNKQVLNTMAYHQLGIKDIYTNPNEEAIQKALKSKRH